MKKEEELYIPVKKYFEEKGFTVKAEVNDCDCVCVKDDLIIICEFKLHFNMSLIFQAMDRQKITDYVYVCIPRYKGRAGYRNFLKAKKLVEKLSLGLIIVSVDTKIPECVEVVTPMPYVDEVKKQKINYKKKENLLKEYNGRTFDLNTGGQSKRKINTAYKEKCIHVLCVLEKEEEVSTKVLIENYGLDKSITRILYNNFLGYFIKTENFSSYKMSKIGKKALDDIENEKLVSYFREKISKNLS